MHGVDSEDLPALTCRYVSETEPYDAVISTPEETSSENLEWLMGGPSPLSTVIVVGSDAGARADYVAESPNVKDLTAGLHIAVHQRELLEAVSDIPFNQDREGLIALGLMFSRGTDIEPVIDAAKSWVMEYPMLGSFMLPQRVLESIADMGLCRRTFSERLHICGECRGARILAREVCANCKSANIDTRELVNHYRCGHQAPRTDFLQGELLVCPKCNSQLRHFGVDYDTPGQVIVCKLCGSHENEPAVAFLCIDCQHQTDGESAGWIDYFSYTLTAAGEAAVRKGSLPGTQLESALSGLEAWRSPRDMALLINFCRNIYERYERPYSLLTIELRDDEEIFDRLGSQGITKVYRLVVDTVASSVRETDGVSLFDRKIILCLPETSPEQSEYLVKRLRSIFHEQLKEPGDVKIDILDEEEEVEILKQARSR